MNKQTLIRRFGTFMSGSRPQNQALGMKFGLESEFEVKKSGFALAASGKTIKIDLQHPEKTT